MKYCVQRENNEKVCFEWLSKKPKFNEETDEIQNLKWTDNHEEAFDLKDEASKWASMIDNASMVRFGDAPESSNIDFQAIDLERRRQARKERGQELRDEKKK